MAHHENITSVFFPNKNVDKYSMLLAEDYSVTALIICHTEVFHISIHRCWIYVEFTPLIKLSLND